MNTEICTKFNQNPCFSSVLSLPPYGGMFKKPRIPRTFLLSYCSVGVFSGETCAKMRAFISNLRAFYLILRIFTLLLFSPLYIYISFKINKKERKKREKTQKQPARKVFYTKSKCAVFFACAHDSAHFRAVPIFNDFNNLTPETWLKSNRCAVRGKFRPYPLRNRAPGTKHRNGVLFPFSQICTRAKKPYTPAQELRNSTKGGIRTRQTGGFFAPAFSRVVTQLCREAVEYKTRMGNKAGRPLAVSNLPAPVLAGVNLDETKGGSHANQENRVHSQTRTFRSHHACVLSCQGHYQPDVGRITKASHDVSHRVRAQAHLGQYPVPDPADRPRPGCGGGH